MGCLRIARIANACRGNGRSRVRLAIAQAFKNLNRIVYACDIGLGAEIPASCKFPHQGLGTVIHERAVFGDRCIVYQGVTVAQDVRGGVPLVGDDVMIGANSTLIGGIEVGAGSRIGAGAVVTQDVPPGTTVVGVPAKAVGKDWKES